MSEQACGFRCSWPPILRSMFLPSLTLIGSVGNTNVGPGLKLWGSPGGYQLRGHVSQGHFVRVSMVLPSGGELLPGDSIV